MLCAPCEAKHNSTLSKWRNVGQRLCHFEAYILIRKLSQMVCFYVRIIKLCMTR